MLRYGLVLLVIFLLSACSSGYQASSATVSGSYGSVGYQPYYRDSYYPRYYRYNRYGFNRYAYRYPNHYTTAKKRKHYNHYKHHYYKKHNKSRHYYKKHNYRKGHSYRKGK